MEKSTKAEYVAVPTSDIDQEAAGLPPYEEQEAITADKAKSRRRFRFLLIGGAVTLLGLTHLCASNGAFDDMNALELRPQDAPEPCALRHLEQYSELKQHMEFLEHAFGEPHFPPPPHHAPWDGQAAPEEPEHRHKHHKHHKEKHNKHKHHKEHDDEPASAQDEKPHHRHHSHGEGHRPAPPSPPQHPSQHLPHHLPPRPPHHPNKDVQEMEEGAVRLFEGDHHKKYEPFCKAQDLISKSSIFEFSPEEFKRAGIFSGGLFDRGSRIILSKSTDESLKNVKVNVTVSAGRDDLSQEVKVSAFDHDGEYSVQVEHGHFHHPHHRHALKDVQQDDEQQEHEPKKEDCLIYTVNVEFPADLEYFDQLNVKAKGAFFKGGKGIEGVEFGSVKAAIGRGAVIFDGLRAKNLLLGVFRGVVMGTYQPSETFSAGAIHGAAKVKIEPTAENVNITASSTFGPASVDIPADSFKGRFTLFNLFGEASTIEAPNPEDIHVQKFRPTVKTGYYKEDNAQSRVVVAAKLKGGERLTFN